MSDKQGWRKAVGCDPDYTGGLPPELAIRVIRGLTLGEFMGYPEDYKKAIAERFPEYKEILEIKKKDECIAMLLEALIEARECVETEGGNDEMLEMIDAAISKAKGEAK